MAKQQGITIAGLKDFIEGAASESERLTNALNFKVQNNPAKVYEWLRMKYPGILPVMQKGMESSEYYMDKMVKIIHEKAMESGNHVAYFAEFDGMIPYNPDPRNWTRIIG